MSDKPYNVLVFIGRFQPFHNGHKRVIDRALELADNVLVLVGSSNRSRSIRNPFTFEERKDMIERTYSKVNSAHERVQRYVAGTQIYDFLPRVKVRPLDDVMYNDDRWIEQVQRTVTRELLEIANRETPNGDLLMTTQQVTAKKRQLKGDWAVEITETEYSCSDEAADMLQRLIEDEIGNAD